MPLFVYEAHPSVIFTPKSKDANERDIVLVSSADRNLECEILCFRTFMFAVQCALLGDFHFLMR